jgi:aminopeptidase-like protein
MTTMMQILRDLTPLNRAICSLGYDEAVQYLCRELPFRIINVPSSYQHNGWVIPPSWDVEEARICKDGATIYDGTLHALGVIALSSAFCGTVDLDELKRHLYYDHRDESSIPFHYRQQFRSWSRDWGFCIPKRLFDQLEPGKYEISIRTHESPGVVKILEYKHKGIYNFTIALGANLDHAGVANDGLAGVVVGVELMRRLCERKTKFNYTLILSPGIIGSELYLSLLSAAERRCLFEGIFLEMLGSDTQLAVQDSRKATSILGNALRASLGALHLPFRSGPFESIIVNDEYIWENYGIPMLSLSRFPYPAYHSSRDSVDNIKESALEECVEALICMIDHVESSFMLFKQFEGNVCLSNPQYNLYVDNGQVAFGDYQTDEQRKLRSLMDLVPSLDRPVTVKDVADRVGLKEEIALEYLQRWAEKNLIDIT